MSSPPSATSCDTAGIVNGHEPRWCGEGCHSIRSRRSTSCSAAASPTGTPVPLLDDPEADLRTYLVRLALGATATPDIAHKGTELVAVIAGLVQIHLSSGRPVLRQGEALLAYRSTIRGWRNIGQRPAALFSVIRD
jgi:hypothetical protein